MDKVTAFVSIITPRTGRHSAKQEVRVHTHNKQWLLALPPRRNSRTRPPRIMYTKSLGQQVGTSHGLSCDARSLRSSDDRCEGHACSRSTSTSPSYFALWILQAGFLQHPDQRVLVSEGMEQAKSSRYNLQCYAAIHKKESFQLRGWSAFTGNVGSHKVEPRRNKHLRSASGTNTGSRILARRWVLRNFYMGIFRQITDLKSKTFSWSNDMEKTGISTTCKTANASECLSSPKTNNNF